MSRRGVGNIKGVWVAAISGFLCLVLGVIVTLYVGALVREGVVSKHKGLATASLSAVRARLEGTFSGTHSVAKGIMSFIALNPNVTEKQFHNFAGDLIDRNDEIRVVALAPDNVIKFIYPDQGNRKAIGMDYTKNQEQWPYIKQAIDTKAIVLSGPIDLVRVRGGRGLILRVPLFVPTDPNNPRLNQAFWGVSSLVIDEQKFMAAAGIQDMADGYYYALKGAPNTGAPTKPILGNQNLFTMDSVFIPVDIPGAESWELAAYPINGWNQSSTEVLLAYGLGYVFSALIALLAFMLVLENAKNRQMALQDPLTGLPNRRLLEDRMKQLAAYSDRSGMGFQIFFVDLNRFKPINDAFGHGAGDQLLREVGHRLGEETRKSDTVARVGGDEFIVLTPGTMSAEFTEVFMRRLADRVREPFMVGGKEVAVEASVGQAVFPQDASTIHELLMVADTRMYAHKGSRGGARPAPA